MLAWERWKRRPEDFTKNKIVSNRAMEKAKNQDMHTNHFL